MIQPSWFGFTAPGKRISNRGIRTGAGFISLRPLFPVHSGTNNDELLWKTKTTLRIEKARKGKEVERNRGKTDGNFHSFKKIL